MTYATTFSGIGGWKIGLNACGWDLKWQCECEPYCRALLEERFGVPIYEDIRTICEQQPEEVDALIGSPPCQPFSIAGTQRGTADERHLYPAFLELVRHIQPRYVLMEQVPAILSNDGGRAFGEYVGGLAALGFSLVYHCIPACAVGAPHRRDRIWIIAHAANTESQRRGEAGEDSQRPQERLTGCGALADTDSERLQGERTNSDSEGRQGQDVGQVGLRNGTGIEFARQWLTEPDVGRVANGIPARAHRLRGLGNAVVPQIPYLIGQAINEIENYASEAPSDDG